ncbi:hypothetical protein [Rhizobium sp. RU35A]|uniref:hypothetical protein n=1 Tax=Rhizobium sp. RU35A TaxID=1907414 RepID=UPI00122D0157|nr:hypothetical protein [Rhizobium sp. RU35A]
MGPEQGRAVIMAAGAGNRRDRAIIGHIHDGRHASSVTARGAAGRTLRGAHVGQDGKPVIPSRRMEAHDPLAVYKTENASDDVQALLKIVLIDIVSHMRQRSFIDFALRIEG